MKCDILTSGTPREKNNHKIPSGANKHINIFGFLLFFIWGHFCLKCKDQNENTTLLKKKMFGEIN